MSQIIKSQSFERDEEYGGGMIEQICKYNSVSEWIEIETDEQKLSLPTFEWTMLISLINDCLETKNHKL